MTPMFKPTGTGFSSIPDRIRGCISLVICISSFVGAHHFNEANDLQWTMFFMITAFCNMLVTLGLMFKDMEGGTGDQSD
jgi:hypothetical protein